MTGNVDVNIDKLAIRQSSKPLLVDTPVKSTDVFLIPQIEFGAFYVATNSIVLLCFVHDYHLKSVVPDYLWRLVLLALLK